MSKSRSSLYLLSLAILALIAYRTKMAHDELALWEAIIGFGFMAATDVLAAVKTWPWKRSAQEVATPDE